MSNPFPPEPGHVGAIEAAFKALGSVLQAQSATYISSPITSGRRFVRALPLTESERIDLVSANLGHSRAVVARLRKRIDGLAVDPAAMADVDEWDQCDYRQLWVEVIGHYAVQAVFIDEWQFSKGCVLEFATCVRAGIPALDESLEALRISDGLAMISEAALTMEQAGQDSAFHRAVLDDLQGAFATT